MASKSKSKGSNAERALAKSLTEWTGEEWRRVPNSGALRWGGAAWVYGDLLPPESWAVIVESKHYATVDLDGLLRLEPQPTNPLGWWDQVVSDVRRCFAETGQVCQPVLVYRANRRPARLVLEPGLWAKVQKATSTHIQCITLSKPGYSFVILDLAEVYATVDPTTLRLLCQSHHSECLEQRREPLPTSPE